jgi:hypothetical protein
VQASEASQAFSGQPCMTRKVFGNKGSAISMVQRRVDLEPRPESFSDVFLSCMHSCASFCVCSRSFSVWRRNSTLRSMVRLSRDSKSISIC